MQTNSDYSNFLNTSGISWSIMNIKFNHCFQENWYLSPLWLSRSTIFKIVYNLIPIKCFLNFFRSTLRPFIVTALYIWFLELIVKFVIVKLFVNLFFYPFLGNLYSFSKQSVLFCERWACTSCTDSVILPTNLSAIVTLWQSIQECTK